jgi:hypothetical protein
MSNPAGDAINTRFGLFPSSWHFNYPENVDSFPSAPNVIDYPRDSELYDDGGDQEDCEASGAILGNGGWGDVDSQCITPDSNPKSTVKDMQPSTFTRENYETYFNVSSPPGGDRRYDYYHRELLTGLPVSSIAVGDLHNSECQCNVSGRGFDVGCKPDACRMNAGQPDVAPNPDIPSTYVGTDDTYKRRELFLSMIACSETDFGAPNPVIDLAATNTKWARFFLTEHVGNPSSPEVYTEFIEEVTQKEDEHFKKVIQLYE